MLDLDRHQGKYGERLVQLIATAAGYNCYKPDDEGDHVDLVITHTQGSGAIPRPPNIELQVKTVRNASITGSEISYDLDVETYNTLCAPGGTRMYLVVVLVPGPDPIHWYGHGESFMVFSRAAYWKDLLNEPRTENASKIAVRIPLKNRYTPSLVREHMTQAEDDFKASFGLMVTRR